MQDEKLKGFLASAQMKAAESNCEFMTEQGLVFPVPDIPFGQLGRLVDPTIMISLIAIAMKYGKDEKGAPLSRLDRNPGLQTVDMIRLGAAILAKSKGT